MENTEKIINPLLDPITSQYVRVEKSALERLRADYKGLLVAVDTLKLSDKSNDDQFVAMAGMYETLKKEYLNIEAAYELQLNKSKAEEESMQSLLELSVVNEHRIMDLRERLKVRLLAGFILGIVTSVIGILIAQNYLHT
jgi:hypothetical protein